MIISILILIPGEKISKDECKKLFKSMDTSGKGVLTYSNFCKGNHYNHHYYCHHCQYQYQV